jgi:tight adherence protein B
MPGLLIFIFLVLFGLVLAGMSVGFKVLEDQRKRRVSAVLATAGGVRPADVPSVLLDGKSDSLPGSLTGLWMTDTIQEAIRQAGVNWSIPGLLTMSFVGMIAGLFLGKFIPVLVFPWLSMIALAGVFASMPWLLLASKRRKRLNEIEEQLPESLDFLARSMRAGHAFSISLEMLGEEAGEPLGQEIRTVFNELNLGAPIEEAFSGLLRRVPLTDMRFFVSSVLLQRQTGGNMSEILNRLAHVIRERFRLKGQVKAASAHARITALVLTLLPVFTALALMVVAPSYLPALAADPDGKWLIVSAILAQVLGYITMRRIINIKV